MKNTGQIFPSAVEIVGGVMILLGALVPIAAIPMAVILLVAIVTVHLPNGFFHKASVF